MTHLHRMEEVAATLDRLAREGGTAIELTVVPYWVPAFVERSPGLPERSRTLAYFDVSEMFATPHEPGCGQEFLDRRRARRAPWQPVPEAELKSLIDADSRPRIAALAVRHLAQARTTAAVEFLEKRLDDPRPAGPFPFLSMDSRSETRIEWRSLTVGDVVLAAMNHMLGDFQQRSEFAPFASAAEYRAWRKETPNLIDSVDVWRNGLEVAQMNAHFELPGEEWNVDGRIRRMIAANADVAAIVLLSRPTFSHYGIGAEEMARMMAKTFPEPRVLRILSGQEDVPALRGRSDGNNFRRWLLEKGLTAMAAPRILELCEEQPSDPGLATLAARLHPSRRRDVLKRCLDAVDLDSDLSESLYPHALAALAREGDAGGVARFLFRPVRGDWNAVIVLDAMAQADPATVRAALSTLVRDDRFTAFERRLVEGEVEWAVFQSFLRSATRAGFDLPGFKGAVMGTDGTSPYYPSLAGWTPQRPVSAFHLEVRRTLVDRIKAWL